MLEPQKLVDKTMGFSAWGPWQALPLFAAFLALLLCISLNLGLHRPEAERHQDQGLEKQQQVLAILQALPQVLEPQRVLDDAMGQQVLSQLSVLLKFRELQSAKSDINPTRDPMTFMGRLNLIVDDLQIIQSVPLLVAQQKRLFDDLGAVRPALAAKRYPDGSAARGFQWVCLSWLDAQKNTLGSDQVTWQVLEDGKPLWQSMMRQMAAFSLDLASSEVGARQNAARDLRDFLNTHERFEQLRQTDALLTQVSLAKDRLSVSLNDLPPAPTPEVNPAQFWQWMIFPGSMAQGLEWLTAASALLLVMLALQFLAHRKGMRNLAQEWANWSIRQEVKIRKTTPGLQGIQESIAQMSDDLEMLADRFLMAAQAVSTQSADDAPALPWSGVRKLQQDIQSEVRLTREKLLNLNVQFCSGVSHESLIYDMAYIAQALESVEITVGTLMKQLDLIGQRPLDHDLVTLPVLSEQWRTEVLELKRQLKIMRKQVQGVEGLIDRAAEKIPHTLRFEDMNGYDATGRRIESSK